MEKTPYRLVLSVVEGAYSPEEVKAQKAAESGLIEYDENTEKYYSYLSKQEYDTQSRDIDSPWRCPVTGIRGMFDEKHFSKTFKS